MARMRRKTKPQFIHIDATPERLSKGDPWEMVNPADIDDTEQAISYTRRFRSPPLDRLHNRGLIDQHQYTAGDKYREAHHNARMTLRVVASYGERTTGGECAYGLPVTDRQRMARDFIRQCREQFEDRSFMDRFLIEGRLPQYAGRKYYAMLSHIRYHLDALAQYLRLIP